jgi:penicillin-binding protein 1A
MSWLPVPAQRVVLTVAVIAAVMSPSAVTLWVSTPSTDDIQQRVLAATQAHGVVLLREDEVPRMLARAVVATEDERFYSHHGIDTIGLGRAVLYDGTHFCLCQGGSTITEQLIKDVYLNGSDAGNNKIVDIVMALKVERVIGKDRIMADYLSEITTGANRYGVTQAACAYFHQPLGSLSIGQYALLAGVTQAPSLYDPTVNPDLAALRRSGVLAAMLADKFITADQAAAAAREPVLAPGPAPTTCPA